MIEVKGYVCDFCKAAKKVRRVYASKGSCKRHEETCYRNPKSRACATCALWFPCEDDHGRWFNYCRDEHDFENVNVSDNDSPRYESIPLSQCEHWEEKK